MAFDESWSVSVTRTELPGAEIAAAVSRLPSE
jgi:hypothetical protein